MEREVHDQLLQLHSLQLQLCAKQGQAEDSDTIKDRLVGGMSQISPNQARLKLQDTAAFALKEKKQTAITDYKLHISCGFVFLCFAEDVNAEWTEILNIEQKALSIRRVLDLIF